MTVPITGFKITDIQAELGESGQTDAESLMLSENVVAAGLDPAYCSGLSDLRTQPYDIGKFRGYTNVVVSIYGIMNGTVTYEYTGIPIENAKVEIIGTGKYAFTNSLGFYEITDITPGTYIVEVSKSGYNTTVIHHAIIVANETLELNTILISV